MSEKKTHSILNLPEPRRSEVLASRGYTEEEFRAYLAGMEAAEAESDAEAEAAGIVDREMHYGDDLPGVVVVNSPE